MSLEEHAHVHAQLILIPHQDERWHRQAIELPFETEERRTISLNAQNSVGLPRRRVLGQPAAEFRPAAGILTFEGLSRRSIGVDLREALDATFGDQVDNALHVALEL